MMEGQQTPIRDYYEVMQISRNADMETVHRVYRIMVARFHPDNAETGSHEHFLALKQAYEVLSDPVRRKRYDADHPAEQAPLRVFEMKDFLYGVEGEKNRRIGLLAILFSRRRRMPDQPGVSLLDLERYMAFPREYLGFTIWYLKASGHVVQGDNSDYELTAQGLDYLETHFAADKRLVRLLSSGLLTDPDAPPMTLEPASPPSRPDSLRASIAQALAAARREHSACRA